MSNITTKWQLGWDDANIPAFGLDFFDSENEAQQRGESLSKEGETGIVLTKLENDEPTWYWQFIDGNWE